MSEDLEKLSREELIARLKKAEAEASVNPNSIASVLMMDAKDAPAHYFKNVMHPAAKIFGLVMIIFWLFIGIYMGSSLLS